MKKHKKILISKTGRYSIFSRIGNPFLIKRKKKKSGFKKRFQYMKLRRYLVLHSFFWAKQRANISKIRKTRYMNRFFIPSRELITYKNIKLLHRFIGYRGQIIPRRVTKVSVAVQRLLTTAIKRARILGLLPFAENAKHSHKVRMIKQHMKEKKLEKKYKDRYKTKEERRPYYKKKEKGTANPGKNSVK